MNKQTLIDETKSILEFMEQRKVYFDEIPDHVIYKDTNEKACDQLARRLFILNEFFDESVESLADILIKYHPHLFGGDNKDLFVNIVNNYLQDGKRLVTGIKSKVSKNMLHNSSDKIIYTIKDDNVVIATKTISTEQNFGIVHFIKHNKIIDNYFSIYGTATLEDFVNASTEPDNAKYIAITPDGVKAYQIKDGMTVLDLTVFAMYDLNANHIVLVKLNNNICIKDTPIIKFNQINLNHDDDNDTIIRTMIVK